jgi:hypothetical protein
VADVRVPGDAVPPIKAVLEAWFGVRVRVVDEVPADWQPDAPGVVPLIVVHDDSGPTLWPVWTEPLIRCTVHADGLQTAKLLRREATGVVLAAQIQDMHIGKTGIGYVDGRDPDTGADLASFTVTATVRTEVITV